MSLADRDDQNRQPLLVTAIESVTPAYKVTTRKCDSELRITECRIFVTEYSRICATHIDLDRFVGGASWRFDKVDAFRQEGRGFKSRSNRHSWTLDKSFTCVALRRVNSDTVSIVVIGSASQRLMWL